MTHTPTPHRTDLARRLRNQAAGSRTAEAAAIIISRACGGHLLDRAAPFVENHPDVDRAWLDYPAALDGLKGLSGGERRLVELAASLATYGTTAVTVNLDDALTGLDDTNARIVLHAIAHALNLPAPAPR
jgi:ABC-type multidrug transport system fused ATPase/permease subunit